MILTLFHQELAQSDDVQAPTEKEALLVDSAFAVAAVEGETLVSEHAKAASDVTADEGRVSTIDGDIAQADYRVEQTPSLGIRSEIHEVKAVHSETELTEDIVAVQSLDAPTALLDTEISEEILPRPSEVSSSVRCVALI